jgi:release factor glutamine methyltransferase
MKYVEKEIERADFKPRICTWTSPLGEEYNLKIPNTVYPPREDTDLLAKTLIGFNPGPGRKLLEIGSGSGVISIFAKKLGWDVVGCDINPLAVAGSRGLAEKYNVENIEFIEGGIEPKSEQSVKIFEKGPFDLILWNLPYLEKPNKNELLGPLEDASLSNIGEQKLHEVLLKKIGSEEGLSPEGGVILIHNDIGSGRMLTSECRKLGWACKSINNKILEDGERLHATLIWKPWQSSEKIELIEVESTNTYLLDGSFPEGTFATTKKQTKGRGQRKNEWVQFKGGWCGSWAIPLENSSPQLIQAKAALAVIESIAAINGNELPTFDYLAMSKFLQNNISIKWPNDLLIGNKKFSGILCEAKTTGKETICVIGIGCNLRNETGEIHSKFPNAASLSELKNISDQEWTNILHASMASKFQIQGSLKTDDNSEIIKNWWLSMQNYNKNHFVIINSKRYKINELLADGELNLISSKNNLNSKTKCSVSYDLEWEKILFD